MDEKPQSGLEVLYAAFLILAITNLIVSMNDRAKRKRWYTCKKCGHKQKK